MRSKINNEGDYRKVRSEYLADKGVFSTDTLKQKAVKDFVRTRLSLSEQTTIIMYAECGSLSKLSKALNIPKSTIHIEVQRIKNKIRRWYILTYSC